MIRFGSPTIDIGDRGKFGDLGPVIVVVHGKKIAPQEHP